MESTLRHAERSIFREIQRDASLRRYVRERVLLGKLRSSRYFIYTLVDGVHHPLKLGL